MKINRCGKEGGGRRGVRKTRGWGGGGEDSREDRLVPYSVCV